MKRNKEFAPLYKDGLRFAGFAGSFAYVLGPLFVSIYYEQKYCTQEEFHRSVAIYYSVLAVLTLNVFASALGVYWYGAFVKYLRTR
jgi:hypothetical protein